MTSAVDIDLDELLDATGGNPFLVSEAIQTGLSSIPTSVADSVRPRVAAMSDGARSVLEVVSLLPRGSDLRTVLSLTGEDDAIDECVQSGLLQAVDSRLRFRHELVRRAIQEAIGPARRRLLHERILATLSQESGHDAAELAHHAVESGDLAATVKYSSEAGLIASRLGANRAAAQHFSNVVAALVNEPTPERAEALEGIGDAVGAIGLSVEATSKFDEAAAIWSTLGRPDRAGRAKVQAASHAWTAGMGPEARARMAAAVEELFPIGGAALAMGLAQQARLQMLSRDIEGAIESGTRAIALAEPLGETESLSRAYNAVGTASWFEDPGRAEQLLEKSIQLAQELGSAALVGSAMTNLGSGAGEVRRYDVADRWLDASIQYCGERDLDGNRDYSTAWRSRTYLERGRLAEAGSLANEVLARSEVPIARMVALTVLGLVRARRGDPGADESLREADRLATATDDIQRLWPVSVARAEAQFIQTGEVGAVDALERVLARADAARMAWAVGDILPWLLRAGRSPTVTTQPAPAYRLWVARDFDGAAAAWEEIGCPFELAMIRIDEGTERSLLRALSLYESVGSTASAARVRRTLKQLGVKNLPRGPRASTSSNPGGLTSREAEVAKLVSIGLSNESIASELVLSTRTVEHHVSAVLRKLGADSRSEVAAHVAEPPLEVG
jgi:DNA-binding CsgD family transcriptional regulator/tetratricopeptide (TPR) repeat protein